jgi:hypothetical protein
MEQQWWGTRRKIPQWWDWHILLAGNRESLELTLLHYAGRRLSVLQAPGLSAASNNRRKPRYHNKCLSIGFWPEPTQSGNMLYMSKHRLVSLCFSLRCFGFERPNIFSFEAHLETTFFPNGPRTRSNWTRFGSLRAHKALAGWKVPRAAMACYSTRSDARLLDRVNISGRGSL